MASTTYMVSGFRRIVLFSFASDDRGEIILCRFYSRQHVFTVIEYAAIMEISRQHAHRLLAAAPRANEGRAVFAAFLEKFPERYLILPTGAF